MELIGNLKIKLIYSHANPINKWLVWERNVGKRMFSNFVPLRTIEELNQLTKPVVLQTHGNRLFRDESNIKEGLRNNETEFQPDDRTRKLTINEYFILERIVKSINKEYNKKKDILM